MLKKRVIPTAIHEVTSESELAEVTTNSEIKAKQTQALESHEASLDDDDDDDDDILDPLPEGLKRGEVSSGASVQYTNKEKARTKRSILKATEKVDSGYVKLGSDVPKYIADELSFMSKRADLSQKDYVLKLILEDMFKRGVFVEPKANN